MRSENKTILQGILEAFEIFITSPIFKKNVKKKNVKKNKKKKCKKNN